MESENTSEDKRKLYTQEHNRSPWSSESTTGSTSPLPTGLGGGQCVSTNATTGANSSRFHFEHSFGSGGSTCSLGSSPGASFSSSLTVPDYNPGGGQMIAATSPTNRGSAKCCRSPSPSPFNLKARVRRRREKRLEKQANMNTGETDHVSSNSDPATLPDPTSSVSPQPSQSTMLTTGSCTTPNSLAPTPSPTPLNADDSEAAPKPEKSNTFKFKELRKRSKESLSFRRRKRNHEPMASLDHSMLSVNHPYSTGTSPLSPRSPISPGGVQCRCRRCSFLPLEECEPKEVSALFKFLRKSKVIVLYFYELT